MKAEVGDLVLWTTNHGMLYFGRVYDIKDGTPWAYDYYRQNKHVIEFDHLVIAGTRVVDGKVTGVEDDRIVNAIEQWSDDK